MNLDGRESMLRAAVHFSAVDGDLAEPELDMLNTAGQALGLSKAHVRGLIAEAFEWDLPY